jgi:hypothetical protein
MTAHAKRKEGEYLPNIMRLARARIRLLTPGIGNRTAKTQYKQYKSIV